MFRNFKLMFLYNFGNKILKFVYKEKEIKKKMC